LKAIACPICGEVTVYNTELEFYICMVCSCEIWPCIDPLEGLEQVISEDIHRGNGKGGNSIKKKKKPFKRSKMTGPRYLE
jgi:hypothetical protein